MINYFRNWNFPRILRLVLGVFILVQGIESQEWLLAALGGFIALMPVFNIGTCGTTCNTSVRSKNQDLDDTTYEEIK